MHRSVVTFKEYSCRKQRLCKVHFTEQSAQILPKLCSGKHSGWLLYRWAMSLFGNFGNYNALSRAPLRIFSLPRQCYYTKRAWRKQTNKKWKGESRKLNMRESKRVIQSFLAWQLECSLNHSICCLQPVKKNPMFFSREGKEKLGWLGDWMHHVPATLEGVVVTFALVQEGTSVMLNWTFAKASQE